MIDFGLKDPRDMPPHFFYGSKRLDFASAVPARVEKQNAAICPRYWYVDAVFACASCAEEFTFSAKEQRVWFEEYGFWVDAFPKHCLDCRRKLRAEKRARQDYDRLIKKALAGSDPELKRRVAGIIDQLCELGGDLPPRIHVNRRRLARQLSRE